MRCLFSNFMFDIDNCQLYRNGMPIPVRPKTNKLLAYLLQNSHRLVSRDEIMETIWAGRCVNDEALTTCIKEIRKILDDTDRNKKYIVTRYGLGYQFIKPVLFENEMPPAFATAI